MWQMVSRYFARVHSECLTGDVFGSSRCDCGEQLDAAMKAIAKEGRGVLYIFARKVVALVSSIN